MVDVTLQEHLSRGPGRPRDMEPVARRAAVLEAALHVFSVRGFRLATMDEIASQAGMSKKTIYTLFAGKMDLFLDLLRQSRATIDVTLLENEPAAPLREKLIRRVLLVADVALSDEHLSLLRLVIGEAHQTPELAESFSREMLNPSPFGIPECLAEAEEAGTHRFGDVREAGEMLVGMAISKFHFKSLLSQSNKPDPDAVTARVHDCVDLFLRGTRAEG